jgi:segregation and condensation protein A
MNGTDTDQEGGDGEGGTPFLALDGYNGPLEQLLKRARAQQIDLARLPLGTLVDQLAAALQRAPQGTPLGRKGDWVVMASWLLQLRSLLLLPTVSPAQRAAEAAADRLRGRLVGLQEIQALAAWLDRRPLLGRDVFARGQPELLGTSVETGHEVDVIAFLWSCLALFDDAAEGAGAASVYRPRWLDLYLLPDARDRILRLLEEAPEGGSLGRFLPEAAAEADTEMRRRSAWSSTFAASLELGKQGDVALTQDGLFMPIQVCRASATANARRRSHRNRDRELA